MNRSSKGMLTRLLAAACCLGLSVGAQADDFFTDFEVATTINPAATFTITDGLLSVQFEGGTLFTAGVGELYRSGTKSWMVDPLGVRGSTGTAEAILSEGATRVTLYGRTQSAAVIARVRVLDAANVVIQDTDLRSGDWTRVNVTRGSGESLIRTIRVENMSGGTTTDLMAAIEDFEFSTTAAGLGGGGGGGSDGSALAPVVLLVLALGGVAARARHRRHA